MHDYDRLGQKRTVIQSGKDFNENLVETPGNGIAGRRGKFLKQAVSGYLAVKTCATTSQHPIFPWSCKSTSRTHGMTETAAAIRDSISNSFLVLWILIKIFSGLV